MFNIQSLPTLLVWVWVEISLCTLIPHFRQESVTVAQQAEMTVTAFLDKLRVSSFPDRFLHYACTVAPSAHFNYTGSKVHVCLCVTCHMHFWQNDQGLLCATAVTRGWNKK